MALSDGRGGETRTPDFLLPKQALYQAELRPDASSPGSKGISILRSTAVRHLIDALPGICGRGRDFAGATSVVLAACAAQGQRGSEDPK